jgi:hypothetical protein
MFEVMQGKFQSSTALIQNGINFLGSAAATSPASTGLDGNSMSFAGDPAAGESLAILIRCGALNVLQHGGVRFELSRRSLAQETLPQITVPEVNVSMRQMRLAWNEFARSFEGWKMSYYSRAALQKKINIGVFMGNLQQFKKGLKGWESIISEKIGTCRGRWSNFHPLPLLRFYVQLALLTVAWHPDDLKQCTGMNLTTCHELIRLRSRSIDGFVLSNWNELYHDSLLIPLLQICATQSGYPLRPSLDAMLDIKRIQLRWSSMLIMVAQSAFLDRHAQYRAGVLPLEMRSRWMTTM